MDEPPSRDASAPKSQLRVCAGKNRIVQVAGTGSRKLFDKGRQEVFLEWFAATCNVRLSAGKAEVAYQTVFKHRMKDEAFADAWDRALQQGYARLEARLLQEAAPGFGQSNTLAEDGPSTASGGPPPPGKLGEELEVRVGLDHPDVEAAFDPQLALAILREQKRNVHGLGPKRQRTTARVASNKEIADALAKRLKTFALRVAREEAPRPEALPLDDGGAALDVHGHPAPAPPHQGEGKLLRGTEDER